ncbi:MAG: acetyl-CoA carboxylase carboxyltransferase subunit beta [Butyricicoccus sp.]|nr:acetyl-CoA carboxylase carboxyltransferase subunit beta [Butyricicoccus sp.]
MSDAIRRRRLDLLRLRDIRRKPRETGNESADPLRSCPKCGEPASRSLLHENLLVCPSCGYHSPVSAHYRLHALLDRNSFRPLEGGQPVQDPLCFPGYSEKLQALREKTGLNDALTTGTGRIDGCKVVVGVLDSSFLMGSMGAAVGERLTCAVEYADAHKLPLLIFSASGGARMQEGIISLMQMAKTSAALARFSAHGGFYLSVFTHPTTGGVTASFASLGDIMLAEPGALIGFAGPRVIEQTVGQTLPEGFQTAEYLVEHGFLDQIVDRRDHRAVIARLLKLHETKRRRIR